MRTEAREVQVPEMSGLSLNIDKAKKIIADKLDEGRGNIQEEMEVKFMPADLTREGSGMISAMGTRNPFRYEDIAQKTGRLPASFHEATTIVPPEEIQKAGGKLGRIAHTSVMEEVMVGPEPEGGDRAIKVEGISAAVLLNTVGRMRYGALEIFSSRAGILTNCEVPKELDEHPELKVVYENAIERSMEIYYKLTILAMAHFLSTEQKLPEEKEFEYNQRILSMALDHSRNVTPMACTMHGTFTFANALAAQEEITRMWSEYPQLTETDEFCQKTLDLLSNGTPTLLKYTAPRVGLTDQQKYQSELANKMIFEETNETGLPAELEGTGITYLDFPDDNIDKFAAAIISRFSKQSFGTVLAGVKSLQIEDKNSIIEGFLSKLNPYDPAPEELGVISCETGYRVTVGAMMEYVRHRPPKKIGAMFTKDLGHLTHSFWRENFGQIAEDLFEESYTVCHEAWQKLKDAGLESVAPYLIQRADYMDMYAIETGMDMWRLHALRTDKGANLDLREPMRAKHDYLLSKSSSIFKFFPVTYK